MTGGRSISFPFVNPAPRPWSCWGSSNADSAPAKLHLSQGPSSTSAVVYTPSGPGAATTLVKVANIRSLQVDRYSQASGGAAAG
ncbi:hypothetical protein HaLaN_01042 [Haematococcus lacustris]|uniref:Uncharacterized protein n=1 Tax=Haematococcus lacustris TaxID=44745 RepID=A0A699YAM8_HAELA|nr:hypothetical protein HaLaN_01042 [Haematococcus lacustris]